MFKSILLGFNIFSKKIELFYAFLAYIFLGAYIFLFVDFLDKILLTINISEVSVINYTSHIFKIIGINFLWLLLLSFGLLFLITFFVYTVSQIENKKKSSFSKIFTKVLRFTFFEYLTVIGIMIIFTILGSFVNLITIILMFLFFIAIIYIMLIFFIGNVYLGLQDNSVKEALKKGKRFITSYFWSTIGFFILIYIVFFIFYFLFDLIYVELFFINEILSIIFSKITLLFLSLYTLYAFICFIKSKKFI